MTNPHNNSVAAEHFNSSAYRLWKPLVDLQEICEASQHYACSGCPKEPIVAEAARLLWLGLREPVEFRGMDGS